MSFHRQNNSDAYLQLINEINKHIEGGGNLTRKYIDIIYKYRTNHDFAKAIHDNPLLREKIILAALHNFETADRFLATLYSYSGKIASEEKTKRILGEPNYIIFNANDIVNLLVSFKHQHGFLDKHLCESNRYFSIETLAREDRQAFTTILATPELISRMDLRVIRQIAKNYLKKDHTPCFPKLMQNFNPNVIEIAQCMAELGDPAAMLYLANASYSEKLTDAERTKYLQAAAKCNYLPAKAQLAIFNYLGVNGIKTNETKTVVDLAKCLQEANAIKDMDVKKKIEDFLELNPPIKKKVLNSVNSAASSKSATIFAAKMPPKSEMPKPRAPKR